MHSAGSPYQNEQAKNLISEDMDILLNKLCGCHQVYSDISMILP